MSQNQKWTHLIQEKVSRRNFLRGLGILSAGAAASSAMPAGIIATAAPAAAEQAAEVLNDPALRPTWATIEPTTADDLVVAKGFKYQVVIKRGDVFTPQGDTFGDNADWTGWYPIDYLEGGKSTEEGLLVVNWEYINPMLVSGYMPGTEDAKTEDQIKKEKLAVGVGIVHLKKEKGVWTVIKDSKYAKSINATTPIEFTGTVAIVSGKKEVVGTLGNCSGGYTPWGTALSCEENYQSYYGEDSVGVSTTESEYKWEADKGQVPEDYGWVVEIDPFTGTAKKRTDMGRIRHENVAIAIGNSGRVVAYMGDDSRDEVVFKFVSTVPYNPTNREANMDILESGKLYAANFGSGKWIPVVWGGNEKLLGDPKNVGGYTIANQADVLTYCNVAARALGATRTDRPEDIEVHPETGDVYIAFTNNSNHGNFHGQIVRLKEKSADPESMTFDWDIFSVGGPQSGYSSPDNLAFDSNMNLWMVTDISTTSVAKGIYTFQGNNAMFMIPTKGADAGKAYQFASGPVESELTGPTFVGRDALFLAVQHPGEVSPSMDKLTSHWPDGGTAEPRAGVVAITGPFNNKA